MFLLIDEFLTQDELQRLRSMAEQAQFTDGIGTADDMPDQHKHNLQYVPDGENLRTITQLVSNGIGRSTAVQDGALIRQMMPPMMSKYTDGMEYKSHLDTPFMHCNGPLRADLSMTLFLSDPETYDGGELVLETEFGECKIKQPAGGAVFYSTRLYHHVTPITRGERVAVVTWMQSHIGDPAKRKVIGELWRAYELIVEIKGEDSDEARRLMHSLLELTRMWAES
jgi:PKHD-type hydroxylase